MAKRILYTVTATLPDEATAAEYISWLEDGHVDQVVAAGAHSGMIIRLEGPTLRVQTQYVFSTRETFDRYVERDAPALRADGLKRFPPERGIAFSREIGEIV
ncbi:MAG: DUF4286 family protein [Phycisphaerales bacterium]